MVGELGTTVKSLTKTIGDQRVDMQRYWSGLEKANDDIKSMREDQSRILTRLDNTVSYDQFRKLEEHVKTLNGTDVKFRNIGIDLSDHKRVEDVRRFLDEGITSRTNRAGLRNRVIQGIVLAIALAVGAAAWEGFKDNYIVKQEQIK